MRARWREERDLHFSFSGLRTPSRNETLRQWFERHREALDPATRRGPSRWLATASHRLAGRRPLLPEAMAYPGLSLFASSRGRRFPVKAWDPDYYDTLCRSLFVLCPDGDFVWTYRFFEAMACGALPVIESTCVHHEGFTFATLDTPLAELERSPRALEENFERCRERLTVPREALDAAIEAALSREAEAAVH
ncbi:MAG: hypothetical protein P1V51_01410 [Deltaproteobacteria bacterium]|nr:hypothetical protein [Deltaproteobacteria bacterium]